MGGWSLGGAGGVHVFCRLVMAWLAHAIRFRCEVVAFTRFVTVRLSWALALHSLLLWRWLAYQGSQRPLHNPAELACLGVGELPGAREERHHFHGRTAIILRREFLR